MEKLTEEKAREKFAPMLEKHGALYITEDGNAFMVTDAGKTNAYSHASRQSPPMKVWHLKKSTANKTTTAKKSTKSKTAK